MSKYINEGLETGAELSLIVDRIAVVATLDQEYKFLEANYNFSNLLGKELSTLFGKSIFTFLTANTDELYLNGLKENLRTGFSWNEIGRAHV